MLTTPNALDARFRALLLITDETVGQLARYSQLQSS